MAMCIELRRDIMSRKFRRILLRAIFTRSPSHFHFDWILIEESQVINMTNKTG